MNFMHLVALWGLLALAVPLLLLLFLNRRKLILPWAAYEWMRQAVIRHRKRTQVTDILKLISKLLLLLVLTLMIGRPYLTLHGRGGRTMLIVDVSPSMGATLDNGTRLDRAVKLADDFIGRYEGQMSLFAFGSELDGLVPTFTVDKGLLRDRLHALRLKRAYGNFANLIRQLPQQVAFGRAQRVIFIGDFQTCWYGDGPRVAEELRRIGKGCPMIWIQVDDRATTENCAITGLSLSPEGCLLGRPAFFTVDAVNGAATPVTRTITVFVDEKETAQWSAKLEPREKKSFPLALTFKDPGRHNVRVALEADILPSDNTRYAVLDAPAALKIAAIVPSETTEQFPPDTWSAAAIKAVIPAEALAYTTVSPLEFENFMLDDVNIVMTFQVPLRAGSVIVQRLQAYIEQGGTVIAWLPAINAGEATGFGLGGAVSRAPGKLTRATVPGTYFGFMTDPALKPDAVSFTAALLFGDTAPENIRVKTDGGALGVIKKIGKGRLIALGFVPAPGYTNLQYNPNFVQFMLRLLWEARNWEAFLSDDGAIAEWRAPWVNREQSFQLLDENNVARALAVEGLGAEMRLALPPNLDPGFYRIMQENTELARFGHNGDAGDADLTPVQPSDLQAAIKEGLVYTSNASLEQLLGRRDLSLLMAILLIAAIALEAYAHFFRKNRRQTA